MNFSRFIMAHPRPDLAHWPEPLTAPGAAQACPTCLPSPANQQTSQGDSHPDRPIERAVRFASVPSQFGGFILQRPAYCGETEIFSAGSWRTRAFISPICLSAPGVRRSPAHAFRSGQIGSPVRTIRAYAFRFREAAASLCAPLQLGGLTFGGPAFPSTALPIPALDALICGIREVLPRLRPLAPAAFTDTANQLTFPEYPDSCRPFERAVRFAPMPSRIGVFTFMHPAFAPAPVRNLAPVALICGHCSGRRALRFLGPSAIADAAMQRTFPRPSGSFRPFSPSSPAPNSRLRTKRKGDGICFDLSTGVLGNEFRDSSNNPAQQIGLSYLRGHFPGPNDRQDSTFSRKKCGRAAGAIFPPLLRVSGTLRREFPFFQPTTNTNPYL